MARNYDEFQDFVEQYIQDTGNSPVDTTELGYWIEDELKILSSYQPHLVDVRYEIESRTGSDTTGTSGSLTDTTKSQFIDGDAGKVIHNTQDNTWAVVESWTNTTALVLNAAIMDSGESYEVYNKYCNNNKQIYIGDVKDYLWVDSVEYPIGTKRNFIIYNDVLEIVVDTVADSNSILDPTTDVGVIVRFAKPHVLCQLTDLEGTMDTNEDKGDTSIDIDGMSATEIIERGDEFRIQHHKSIYSITTDVTTSANATTIKFFPGLEAAASGADNIIFTSSTLLPDQEAILAKLVAVRAIKSDARRFIGGTYGTAWSDQVAYANDILSDTMAELKRVSRKTNRTYSRA